MFNQFPETCPACSSLARKAKPIIAWPGLEPSVIWEWTEDGLCSKPTAEHLQGIPDDCSSQIEVSDLYYLLRG